MIVKQKDFISHPLEQNLNIQDRTIPAFEIKKKASIYVKQYIETILVVFNGKAKIIEKQKIFNRRPHLYYEKSEEKKAVKIKYLLQTWWNTPQSPTYKNQWNNCIIRFTLVNNEIKFASSELAKLKLENTTISMDQYQKAPLALPMVNSEGSLIDIYSIYGLYYGFCDLHFNKKLNILRYKCSTTFYVFFYYSYGNKKIYTFFFDNPINPILNETIYFVIESCSSKIRLLQSSKGAYLVKSDYNLQTKQREFESAVDCELIESFVKYSLKVNNKEIFLMLNLQNKELRIQNQELLLLNTEKDQYQIKLELPDQIFHLEENKTIINKVNFFIENMTLKVKEPNVILEKAGFQNLDFVNYSNDLSTSEGQYLYANGIYFHKTLNRLVPIDLFEKKENKISNKTFTPKKRLLEDLLKSSLFYHLKPANVMYKKTK